MGTPKAIHPVRLGLSAAHLIEAEAGLFLVDAGPPGYGSRVWAHVEALGYEPRDLRLVVLTHAHIDHCGCLQTLLQESGAGLAAHPLAAERLQGKPVPLPRGRLPLGRIMATGFRLFKRWLPNPRLEITLPLEEGMDLSSHGLAAAVLHTPGHTADSLTLVLGQDVAFVGDLLVRRGQRACPQPYLIEDKRALAASVARLRERRPRVVYTGHSVRPLVLA